MNLKPTEFRLIDDELPIIAQNQFGVSLAKYFRELLKQPKSYGTLQ